VFLLLHCGFLLNLFSLDSDKTRKLPVGFFLFLFLLVLVHAALSGLYCQVMLVGLYPLFVYEVLKKFLQAQAVVLPQMFVAIIANLWSVGANYLFVTGMDLGYVGAPIARMSTNFVLPVLTLVYMLVFKKFQGSWGNSTCLPIQSQAFEQTSFPIFSRWMELGKLQEMERIPHFGYSRHADALLRVVGIRVLGHLCWSSWNN
jgi:Na+-driven multidrug efflux pump